MQGSEQVKKHDTINLILLIVTILIIVGIIADWVYQSIKDTRSHLS